MDESLEVLSVFSMPPWQFEIMFYLLWPDWSDFILIYRLSLTEKAWNLPIICQ